MGIWIGSRTRPRAADRAAQFASAHYLAHTNAGEYSVAAGTDLTVDLWFCFDSLPGGAYEKIAGTEGGAAATDGWFLQRDGTSGKVQFGYSNGSSYQQLATITPSTGVWYHGTFKYDHTTPVLLAVVQDTTTVLFSGSVGATGAMNVSTQPFRLGAGVAAVSPLSGRLDSICVMNRLLTGGDMDLYNGGAGRTFSDLGGAILTGMVSFHCLDESTGSSTWVDARNGYNLTQTGGNIVSVPRRGLF